VSLEVGKSPERSASLRPWLSLSQEERDAAYDVNLAVSNSADLIEKRNTMSSAFRARHARNLDIPYVPNSDRCAFDLYPAKDPNAPCLVFIHGGWWQRNGRENFACCARGLAASGWSVAIPGYTLAPNASLTEIVLEIGLALDWLAENGPSYRIKGPIVISGWSAGAHLASLYLPHPAVVASLLIAGAYDLSRFQHTKFNDAVRLKNPEISLLSPLRQTPAAKPVAIAVGTSEVPLLIEDSVALHQHRQLSGVPSDFVAVKDANHFTILNELVSDQGLLVTAAKRLIGALNR